MWFSLVCNCPEEEFHDFNIYLKMPIFLDNRNYIRCVCKKKVDIPILWSGCFFGRLKISWSESHREWREVRESEGRWVGGLNPPLPSPPLPSPPLFFRRASLVLFPTAGAWLQVKMFSVRQPRIWNLIFWRIIFYFWWNVGEKTKKKTFSVNIEIALACK